MKPRRLKNGNIVIPNLKEEGNTISIGLLVLDPTSPQFVVWEKYVSQYRSKPSVPPEPSDGPPGANGDGTGPPPLGSEDGLTQKAKDPNIGGGIDREKLKDHDFVFPDERKFPIVKPMDVSDAVSSWGRYKGEHSFDSFKSRLIALCRKKGKSFVNALPDSWDVKEE